MMGSYLGKSINRTETARDKEFTIMKIEEHKKFATRSV